MSNYPDDVRMYDNHPGSPFYVEPPEDEQSDKEDFDEAAAQQAYYEDKYDE